MISKNAYLSELLHLYLRDDPQQGLELWSNLFDQSLQAWDLSKCHQLLREIQRLDPSTEEGSIAYVLSKTSQGMLAAFTGEWEQAVRLYTALLTIVPEDNRGWVLSNLGNIYYLAKDYSSALNSLGEALQEYGRANNASGLAKVFVNLGGIYRETGDIQNAISCLESASQLIPEEDIETRIINLANRAGALQVSGDLAAAEEKYQQAPSYLQQYDAPHLQAQILGNLGILYVDKGDSIGAIEYFLQDLMLHQELDDPTGQAETLNNLGLAHNRTGKTDKALYCYRQSAEIKKSIGDPKGELVSWSNFLIASLDHDHQVPKDVFFRVKQLATELNDMQTIHWLENIEPGRRQDAA